MPYTCSRGWIRRGTSVQSSDTHIDNTAKGYRDSPLPANTVALQDWHLIPMLHVRHGSYLTEHVSCLDIGGYFKRVLHHVSSVKIRLESSIHTLAQQMHRLDPGRILMSMADFG